MDYKVLPLAVPPNTQALTSKTFKPPPLDGSLTLPEIYDWHLNHTSDHPLFVYSDDEGVEYTVPWGEGVCAVHRAAREVQRRVGREANVKGATPTVVAILAAADTITYFLNTVGILRAGYTVFPISPRNSPAAVAHLLRKANVTHILIGSENAIQSLVVASFNLLEDDYRSSMQTSIIPSFKELYFTDVLTEPAPTIQFDLDCISVILHSSGSTAFPKPIYWTHYQLLQISWTPYFGEQDMCGFRFACHSMPMYHGMGLMQTGWTATAGVVITSFQPHTPAILPSPESVMKGSIDTKSDMIFCVPSFVEAWGRNKDYISHLRKIHGILYGGGPLNQEVGDALSKEGVSIFILYGCSEIGIMSPIVPKAVREDWNYFRLSSNIKGEFISDGEGNFELVVVPHPYEVPCVFNTKADGVDAYATSDLLTPHPTKPGYWKIFGRVDDQLIHSTGEKTNPGPLENILNQDPHVLSSVMFGRGRFNAGVIVDPKPEFKFDPNDTKALSEFRQKIWPTVEQMNEYAPQHSRLFKEMIIVSSPEKPFAYTAKNTARRQAIIQNYELEIDTLYYAVQETTQSDIPLPSSWTLPHALDFVRKIVMKVMKHSIGDDADFFRFGCDSLQATWIRNTLLNALHVSADLNTRGVPINFVYDHPSIVSLAAYASKLAAPTSTGVVVEDVAHKVRTMEDMVAKYTENFKAHTPIASSKSFDRDIVLITGTTGGLGALLLAKLLESSHIERVYALNRSGGQLLNRQIEALKGPGFDEKMVESPKLVLLKADLDKYDFGLDYIILEQIRTSVTHIIHNAYPVNFNMSLTSFESSILSLRRLIDLALSSPLATPPRLLFTSSISVVHRHPGKIPVPEEIVEPSSAIGTGYSESKWVCEKILSIASTRTPLKPVTVRIGQMSGANTNGCWNSKEWVPALFKSSIHMNCLPALDADISWLPIDVAAGVILEMRNSSVHVLHLAHPVPVPWSSIFKPASESLGIPLVSYSLWLESLRKSGDGLSTEKTSKSLHDNPALLIFDFSQSAEVQGTPSESLEAMGLKRLSLEEASKVSPTLLSERIKPLSGESVKGWLDYWRSSGFISSRLIGSC
ncbi:acetyl-CoA synthetase-like protein [Phellopilus nigrolimitatus]|nr:acetyl-CoA synthetase-like protein [Phellopilus nigrolimitatus]